MKPDEKKTEAPAAEEPKSDETLPEGALEGASGGRPHVHGSYANDGGVSSGPPIVPEIDPGK